MRLLEEELYVPTTKHPPLVINGIDFNARLDRAKFSVFVGIDWFYRDEAKRRFEERRKSRRSWADGAWVEGMNKGVINIPPHLQ